MATSKTKAHLRISHFGEEIGAALTIDSKHSTYLFGITKSYPPEQLYSGLVFILNDSS